jgi:hypothetical protein
MIKVILENQDNGNIIETHLPFIPNKGTWIGYDDPDFDNIASGYLTVERVIIEMDNSIRILVNPD